MSQKSDPHAGHRPGSFLEAVSWLNRSAYGEKLSCYSLREAVAQVVERECYLRREIERLEAERDALLFRLARIEEVTRDSGIGPAAAANNLARLSSIAPPADAVREAARVRLCACAWCGAALVQDPDALYRWRCINAEQRKCVARGDWYVLDDDRDCVPAYPSSSPAPAPPADAPPLPPGYTHDPSLVCLRCRVVIPMPAPPADAAREDAVTAWARLAVALLSRHESAWEHDPGPYDEGCDEDCRACEYVGLLRTGRAALSAPAVAATKEK